MNAVASFFGNLTFYTVFYRFVCGFSGAVLGVISTLFFTLALLTLILLKEPGGALTTAIVAFVISPYGIHKPAEWFVDRLEDLNFAIKSI